jgi:hypothetical protein
MTKCKIFPKIYFASAFVGLTTALGITCAIVNSNSTKQVAKIDTNSKTTKTTEKTLTITFSSETTKNKKVVGETYRGENQVNYYASVSLTLTFTQNINLNNLKN